MQPRVIVVCIDGMAAYYLSDDRCKMPNLKSLLAGGAKVEKMTSTYPSCTWPAHTTIVTGVSPSKHGILGNWVVEKSSRHVKEYYGDRVFEKEDVVKFPTLYDLAHQKGIQTAAICWPLTRGAKHIDFNIPEFYEQELFEQHSTPLFWQELKEQGILVNNYGPWSKEHSRGQMQDWLTTEVVKYLIGKQKPGLILAHFLLADSFQHDYGTCSPEVFWALEYLDERLGQIIEKLKAEGLYDSTDVFVISDHGFMDAHSAIRPNVLFKQQGWYNSLSPEQSRVIAISNDGSGYIYVFDEEYKDQLVQEIKKLLLATEGVAGVFENQHFERLGLPNVEDHPHQADLIVEAAPGYLIQDAGGDNQVVSRQFDKKATHGYLPEKDEMKGILVACGPSIKPSCVVPEGNIADIAPTIAGIFGIEIAIADGKILESIITIKE
ncbi:hypothetical protein SPSIL_017290 [Sporomusa silvacetica DSM 10669]|uniref:Type I phosphodiesterase / nucleotide pyrophosphatase n=1 Tax=Sporomusa silvacetica DSM 10669 TaxID=1123289 RepID=A0ABZ3IIT2_9FIRM|nr:ectonucleotide pyrophosphatase/phosphodiesterase [Sporomusa silvacetica]OZC18382.1 type I phosphodiesterase / nucleotide pyrophosphatase [Sporomusa silvacetica DSM 10669]